MSQKKSPTTYGAVRRTGVRCAIRPTRSGRRASRHRLFRRAGDGLLGRQSSGNPLRLDFPFFAGVAKRVFLPLRRPPLASGPGRFDLWGALACRVSDGCAAPTERGCYRYPWDLSSTRSGAGFTGPSTGCCGFMLVRNGWKLTGFLDSIKPVDRLNFTTPTMDRFEGGVFARLRLRLIPRPTPNDRGVVRLACLPEARSDKPAHECAVRDHPSANLYSTQR